MPNIGLFYIDVLLLCRFFSPVYICSIAFVTKLILYLCWDFRFSLRIMDTYLYNKALLAIKIDMTCICLPETLFGIKLITKNFRFNTFIIKLSLFLYIHFIRTLFPMINKPLFSSITILVFFSFYHAFA